MPGRLTTRRRRRQHRTKFRLHKPRWIDPFPHIPGTEPEKRFFSALVDQRIFFIFQGQIPELTSGLMAQLEIPGYKPDFVIPEYKVIIDPFSPFHHSLPGAVERDARKVMLYTAFGYVYYHPWAIEPGVFLLDQDHLRRVVRSSAEARRRLGRFKLKDVGDFKGIKGSAGDILRMIPELHGRKRGTLTDKQKRLKALYGYELGPFLGAGATSVAAANRRRRRPPLLELRR